MASILVTLTFIALLNILNEYIDFDLNLFTNSLFGASFIGMSLLKKWSFKFLTLSSLIYTFFFLTLLSFFDGIGGTLGFFAFLATLIGSRLENQL